MHDFTQLTFLGFLIICNVFHLPDFFWGSYGFFDTVAISAEYLRENFFVKVGISLEEIDSNVKRDISNEKIFVIMNLIHDKYCGKHLLSPSLHLRVNTTRCSIMFEECFNDSILEDHFKDPDSGKRLGLGF